MIGILTYYNPINYGAVFQAYAIQEITREKFPGKKVGIIEYCPIAVRNDYKLVKTDSMKALIMSLFNYSANRKRCKIFNDFIANNLNTISFDKVNEVSTLVLGSDQIWNPNISRGFDPVFFGKIGDNKKRQVCSYAASIGVSILNEKQQKEFSEELKNVDHISVREESAKKIIEKIDSNIKVSVDLDPTLLLSEQKWSDLAKEYHNDKPYIFVYSLSGYPETYLTAQKVASYLGAEIIEVTIKNQKPFLHVKHKLLKTVSPEDFLGMIKNSEAVVTDSFHGTVFSLIFHKPMYVIPNKTKGSRMVELLKSVNLESRIVKSENNKLDFHKIDFEEVDKRLRTQKDNSLAHLINSINGLKGEGANV